MSKSRDQLNEFLKKINIDGKTVLDVGVQDKPTSRLTQGTPEAYYTMDIDKQWDPDIVGDLNADFTNWKWKNHELRQISMNNGVKLINSKFGNGNFDVIFCIEVLEHCWNPVKAVQNLADLCKPGGVVYISTPFINPHHDIVDYLRYTGEWYEHNLPHMGFSEVKVHERVATVGKALLQGFYKLEGLRISKIRPEYGNYSYPIGYFVEARK